MSDERRLETFFIFGMAIAAIIGAVTAVMVIFLFPSLSTGGSVALNGKDTQSAHIIKLIEEESATIAVVDEVAPAVVSVVVKKARGELVSSRFNQSIVFGLYGDKTLNEEEAKELVEISSGTGFFVTEDGYLLTNKHVVDEPGASLFVVDNDGKEYKATLIDTDPFQDIAVLKVEGEQFNIVKLGNSDGIRIGQTVIAIGNTLSEFRNTVTKGVVSGINRRVTAGTAMNAEVIDEAIQTDAAINPGNSGGPLINLFGEVIGINTAVSSHGEAVGFAIPINQAKRAIDDVVEFGRIVRPWLGVRYVLVEPKISDDVNVVYDIGALVISGSQPGQVAVFKGSPADFAGIQDGDVIIAINGVNLTQSEALAERISVFRPGDQVDITFLRDGVMKETTITLAEYDR